MRTCAGLILKNNFVHRQVPEAEVAHIKFQVLKAIGDSDATVRRTAGSLITTILRGK